MRLTEQKLRGFRNIESAVFHPAEGVSVICGENGQGKTNLLESVFLLTGAKSFRRAKDKELIQKQGEGFSVIEAAFIAEDRPQTMRLTISEKGRMASLNKASERKASEHAGKFCCVVFSPEHLELVKGTPAERRRFLDTALCQLSSRYYAALREYTRLVQQKNTLLKDARGISAAFDMLDIYDEQLADAALYLEMSRRGFISSLQRHAAEAYGDVSGEREKMSLGYLSTLGETGSDEILSRDAVLAKLRAVRTDDLRAGFSTVGPHRDDMAVYLNDEAARVFASQGQQRTAVLALKLAEAELFRTSLGETPVLLLDDVLSELDANRQQFLLRRLDRSQAIITCCEPDFIKRQTDAAVFEMKNGALTALK
ncbi:MAG: DNA replication/repair protein RecF [Oscillospiraceae bacterium]|nr:DNA replication/repair protein RecF [Oscillospiraceae bacterium]